MCSSNSTLMCSGLMNDSAMRERRRQRHQHIARHASMRGVHAHLAENLEPLPDDVREVVEDLRQVAAGLPLDQNGGHEEPHVDERHPLGEVRRARP